MISRWASVFLAIEKFGFIITMSRLISILLYKIRLKQYINEKGIGKIFLRRGSSDLPVYRQIFLNGEYELTFRGTPKVIVDLGANIGLFSLLMTKKFPNSTIYAIEPDPENFSQLIKNTKVHSNIKIFNKAIWNEIAKLKIVSDQNSAEWGRSVSVLDYDSNENMLVDSLTINELIEAHKLSKLDIVKVDIEGAEFELFLKSTEWVEKVGIFIIEFHDTTKRNVSSSFFKELSNKSNYMFEISGENIVVRFLEHST